MFNIHSEIISYFLDAIAPLEWGYLGVKIILTFLETSPP